jgi:outer membrane protein assembly factor BamB
VGVRTNGQGPLLAFQVPTPREGGIWTPSGPAVDNSGNVYVAVGNGAVTQGAWDHSDSILRLSPSLVLQDGFAPQSWPQENATDADLGSMGPIFLPGGLVFADGKSGMSYVLRANALGGVGGQLHSAQLCVSFGGAAISGLRLVVPCTNGIRAVHVGVGGVLTALWQAPSQITGSPIIGGNTVYSLAGSGKLYALNSATGAIRASIPTGAVPPFATPTLSGSRIFVGTLSGVVAVGLA